MIGLLRRVTLRSVGIALAVVIAITILVLIGSIASGLVALSGQHAADIARLSADEKALNADQQTLRIIQGQLLLPGVNENKQTIAGLLARLDADEARLAADEAKIAALQAQITAVGIGGAAAVPAPTSVPRPVPAPRPPTPAPTPHCTHHGRDCD